MWRRLCDYKIVPDMVDPWADKDEALREYGVSLKELDEIEAADCIIVAVAHKVFKDMGIERVKKIFGDDFENKVLLDVKGLYNIETLEESRLVWWRL